MTVSSATSSIYVQLHRAIKNFAFQRITLYVRAIVEIAQVK